MGPFTVIAGPLTVPNTGGWQAWQTLTATVTLTQGPQKATLVVDADGANAFGNFGPIDFEAMGATSPFSGTPAAIPGTIEAVNFDNGSAGAAFFDTSAGNYGGAYRATDVDIEASEGGGYNVGWVDPAEWLAYTVDVQQPGAYIVSFQVASHKGLGKAELLFDLHADGQGADTGTELWGGLCLESPVAASLTPREARSAPHLSR